MVSIHTSGQCTLNDINTNPNPTYTRPIATLGKEYKTNTFKWWDVDGHIEIGPINSQISNLPAYVTSPFYTSNLDYLKELVDNRDFESTPENGWELIKQDLGYFIYNDPNTHQPSVQMFGTNNGGLTPNYSLTSIPYYIVYNKYTGILRVLFLRNDAMSSYATVAVTLSFEPASNTKSSGLFGLYNVFHSSKLKQDFQDAHTYYSLYFPAYTGPDIPFQGIPQPLNEKSNVQKATSIAVCPALATHWTYADFQMSYDPCTCFWESEIHAEFDAQVQGHIDLTGRGIGNAITYDGTQNQLSTFNGKISPYSPDYLSSFYQGDPNHPEIVTSLVQEYNDAHTIAVNNSSNNQSDFEKFLTGITDFVKGAAGIVTFATSGSVSGLTDVFNFFSWAGSQGDPKKGASMLISEQEVINGTVTISRTSADVQIDIANPGSLNSENAPQYTQMDLSHTGTPEYPEYNNTLGLFSLLHSPKVNFFEVVPTPNGNGYGGIGGGNHNEFQLSGLDYALNPVVDAANTKIFASIEYYFPMIGSLTSATGIPSYSTTSLANLTPVEIFQNNSVKIFKTQTLPIECLSQLVSRIDYIPLSSNVSSSYVVEAFINLQVFYEFVDVQGKRHRSYQKLKYPITLNSVSTALVPTTNFTDLNQFPTNLTLGATTFTTAQTIYSFGTLSIIGDLSNPSGVPIIIEAQNEVNVAPGVTIDPNITLQIQSFPDMCNGLTPFSPLHPDASYCKQGDYKANQSNKRDLNDPSSSPEISTSFNLSLYPNPASGSCTVRFDMEVAAEVSITLTDMMGRVVRQIAQGARDKGTSYIPFSTADIAPGVYMVQYSDGVHAVTKKLSITGQ